MPDFFGLPHEILGRIECISAIFTPFSFSWLSSRWWVQLFTMSETFCKTVAFEGCCPVGMFSVGTTKIVSEYKPRTF